jgi:hypothetical protein
MAGRSYLKEKEHERELIAAWLQRPEAARTENDILKFYGELASAHSTLLDLLFRRQVSGTEVDSSPSHQTRTISQARQSAGCVDTTRTTARSK